MKFSIDDKTYDAEAMNDVGKAALNQLGLLSQEEQQIALRAEHIGILREAYLKVLKEHLPEELVEQSDAE